jgi:hypothetical protein
MSKELDTNADGNVDKDLMPTQDTPVNGEVDAPISSNWAFDHEADTTTHGVTSGAIIGGSLGTVDNVMVRSDGTGGSTVQGTGIIVGDDDSVKGAGTYIIDASDSRAFDSGDIGATVRMTGSGKTLTMPAQSGSGSVFSVNDFINILHDGASTLTIAVTTDTLISDGSKTKIKLGTIATLMKVASARWVLVGNLE